MKRSGYEIINFLMSVIPLKVAQNNKKVYHSKTCPFCKYTSKKSYVFQYQSRLGVGKSYCCGRSFKELSWLRAQFKDPNHAKRVSLTLGHDPFVRSDQHREMLLKELDESLEDKMNERYGDLVKYDLNLPF